MAAWMDNAVHIQVEIVELFAIGIGFCRINGNGVAIDYLWLLLDNLSDNLGELVWQPSLQVIIIGLDSHAFYS